jgi:hypothetical protein
VDISPSKKEPSFCNALLRGHYGGGDSVVIFANARVLGPRDGSLCPATSLFKRNRVFNNIFTQKKKNLALVLVMPQLGDFDSTEYAEQLVAVLPDLEEASIRLRVIEWEIHEPQQSLVTLQVQLACHRGPNWDVPSLKAFAERVVAGTDLDTAREVARAWLICMAMCAWIAAPGTLQEILRGYVLGRQVCSGTPKG